MKTYRVEISRGDQWLIASHRGEPTFTTQGRDLDELAFMVRDAIQCMTETESFELDLVIPPELALRQSA